MKTILTTGLLCVVIGATVGWTTASNHYEAKALKEQTAYSETLAEVIHQAGHYQRISEEYYADYQSAINREPTVVTERVYVKATCPELPTDTAGSVGESRITEIANNLKKITRLGTASERDVGIKAGNVMEVGAFGIGMPSSPSTGWDFNNINAKPSGLSYKNSTQNIGGPSSAGTHVITLKLENNFLFELGGQHSGRLFSRAVSSGVIREWEEIIRSASLLSTTG